MVSVINVMIDSVGMGWWYVILGALCIAVAPIATIVVHMGPKWRARRRERQKAMMAVSYTPLSWVVAS